MRSTTDSFKYGWILCFVLIILNFCILLLPIPLALDLTQEDGIIENASAILLFLAAISFAILYYQSKDACINGRQQRKRNLIFLLLGIFFFVAMGEEISWGQRILGVETPDILKKLNYQEEINLHNFRIFEGKNPDGTQKGGIAAAFTSHRIFYMLILGWTLLVPLVYRYSGILRRLLDQLQFPVHPLTAGFLTTGILIIARGIKIFNGQSSELFDHSVTEVAELNFAIAIAFVGFYWINHLRMHVQTDQISVY